MSQQHWHANPLALAGLYNGGNYKITKAFALYGQVELNPQHPGLLKGRVTNGQLIDTIRFQLRNWWCSAVKAVRGLPPAPPKTKTKLEEEAWFFIGNILHTIQDSFSEAHTVRTFDAGAGNYIALGDHKDQCTSAVLNQIKVARFLGMDFTKYLKIAAGTSHHSADNVPLTDGLLDCSREASKQVIDTFKVLWEKRDGEITKAEVHTATTELMSILQGVFEMPTDVAYNNPAGGNIPAYGTADVEPQEIITEAELADYIRDFMQTVSPRFRYAARSAAGAADHAGQFFSEYIRDSVSTGFLDCDGIIVYDHPEVPENQVFDIEHIPEPAAADDDEPPAALPDDQEEEVPPPPEDEIALPPPPPDDAVDDNALVNP